MATAAFPAPCGAPTHRPFVRWVVAWCRWFGVGVRSLRSPACAVAGPLPLLPLLPPSFGSPRPTGLVPLRPVSKSGRCGGRRYPPLKSLSLCGGCLAPATPRRRCPLMRTSYRGQVCSVSLDIAASLLWSARSRPVLLPIGGLRFSRIVAGSYVARRSAATAAYGRGRGGFPLASRRFDCGNSCASGAPTHRPLVGGFHFFLSISGRRYASLSPARLRVVSRVLRPRFTMGLRPYAPGCA